MYDIATCISQTKINNACHPLYNPLIAGIAKAQVPYGWMTLRVHHLTSCSLHAHTVDLGMTTVTIQRMWLSPVVAAVLYLPRYFQVKVSDPCAVM